MSTPKRGVSSKPASPERLVLYLDSSALIALILEQPWTEEVLRLVGQHPECITLDIAYAEVGSALARARWEDRLDEEGYILAVEQLDQIWLENLNILPNSVACSKMALKLAAAHAPHLRGMDSLHLAAALEQHRTLAVGFLTYDERLKSIAEALMPLP